MEKKFGGEAADCDVSAANDIEEGDVRRRAKRARDIGSESSVF